MEANADFEPAVCVMRALACLCPGTIECPSPGIDRRAVRPLFAIRSRGHTDQPPICLFRALTRIAQTDIDRGKRTIQACG